MSIRIMSLKLNKLILYGLGALIVLILFIVLIVSLAGRSGKNQSEGQYFPGLYSTSVPFGTQSITVDITFSEEAITAVSCQIPENFQALYPLVEPTVNSIGEQLKKGVAVSAVSLESTALETGTYLLDAIALTVEKAERPLS